ncbi:MAG TPA: hypothetical protein VGO93_12500 [Candidatus Xenobia bacterium]|jgi:hypothetical protein
MLATASGVDVAGLKVVTNSLDLRRHLKVYVDYVSRRTVKRTYRGNHLPDGDESRLRQLMEAPTEWLAVVETAAARLGLVDWRTTTDQHDRSGPLFPDNYIRVNTDPIERYWRQPLIDSERQLMDALTTSAMSEFYSALPLSRLDRFRHWSWRKGPVDNLAYGAARATLLDTLAQLAPDIWHGTAALVECMRRARPEFLFDAAASRQCDLEELLCGRSSGVRLNGRGHGFEPREGRYIERFLEGFPLVLGYVDVAYGDALSPEGTEPSWGRLRAFRVRPVLRQVLHRTLPPPRVSVQPDFEVHVEASLAPVGLVHSLSFLGEVVAEDTVSIVRLRRDKVAKWATENPPASLIPWLEKLADRPLPPNVHTELEDWLGQADVFTLYTSHGVVEGEVPTRLFEGHAPIGIGPGVHVVEKPGDLHGALEAAGLVPVHLRHPDTSVATAPRGTTTRFPKEQSKPAKNPARPSVAVQRETTVRLRLSDTSCRDKLVARLVEVRCPFQRDGDALVYSGRHAAAVDKLLESFKSEYRMVEEKA